MQPLPQFETISVTPMRSLVSVDTSSLLSAQSLAVTLNFFLQMDNLKLNGSEKLDAYVKKLLTFFRTFFFKITVYLQ